MLTGSVLIPAAVLTLPAAIPIAAVRRSIETLRLKRNARQFRCPACGQIMGRPGVDLADGAADRFKRELKRWHPDVQFTLVRVLYSICPKCRAHYEFSSADESFKPQAAESQPFLICSCFLWGDC